MMKGKPMESLTFSNRVNDVFPSIVYQLQWLKELVITKGKIVEIEDNISFLPNLEFLNVSRCKLVKVSPMIGTLTNLKSLKLSNNFLKSLPFSISGLVKLSKLELQENELDFLAVAQLTSLTELNLESNHMRDFPFGIQYLPQLQSLSLKDNDLSLLPSHVSSSVKNLDGPELAKIVVEYLKTIEKEKVPWNRLKFVVLGKEAAGKTTIIKYLQNKKQDKTVSTDGIELYDIPFEAVTEQQELDQRISQFETKYSLRQSNMSVGSHGPSLGLQSFQEHSNWVFRICDFGGQAVFCNNSLNFTPLSLTQIRLKTKRSHSSILLESKMCIYGRFQCN